MLEVGDIVVKGDFIGSIEFVKIVFDFYVLVIGKVVVVNEILEDELELINSNLYDIGWILKFEEVEEVDVKVFLLSDDYEKVLD